MSECNRTDSRQANGRASGGREAGACAQNSPAASRRSAPFVKRMRQGRLRTIVGAVAVVALLCVGLTLPGRRGALADESAHTPSPTPGETATPTPKPPQMNALAAEVFATPTPKPTRKPTPTPKPKPSPTSAAETPEAERATASPAPDAIDWTALPMPEPIDMPSAGELYSKGLEYLSKYEYTNGVAYIGLAAQQGLVKAQERLVRIYRYGEWYMPQEDYVADYWESLYQKRLGIAPGDDMPKEEFRKLGRERAQTYYRDGEYTSAAAYLGVLAKEGLTESRLMLAQTYMLGLAPMAVHHPEYKIDPDVMRMAGIYWTELLARGGNAVAQARMGYYYRIGRGVDKSLETAFMWDRLSAAQGCRDGLIHLGYFFTDPHNSLQYVEKNYFVARTFYQAALLDQHVYADERVSELDEITTLQAELETLMRERGETNPTMLQEMETSGRGLTVEQLIGPSALWQNFLYDVHGDPSVPEVVDAPEGTYIGNFTTMIYHTHDCGHLPDEDNRVYFESEQEAIDNGYLKCGWCDR